MAVAPIDLSAGFVPKQAAPIDLSAGLVPKDHTDTRSLLQKAKDNFNAATQGAKPGDSAVKGFVENIGQGGGQVLRYIANGWDNAHSEVDSVRSAAAHPIDAAKGAVDQAHSEVDALRADPSRFIGNAIGQVGVGAILGGAAEEAVSQVAPKMASLGSKPLVRGQNYTSPHAQAFEGAIAPATAMGKNFIPQSITPEALTPIRATAAKMAQGTPVEQGIIKAATSSKTPPLERIAAYQNIVQGSLNDLESQHAPALAAAAKTPVDVTSIVSRLQNLKSATMAPSDVSAIDELVDRVKNAKTIGDLNTFRQELNTETAPEFRQSQVQAGRSGISAQATSDLNGWVRNAYYDNLEQATGQDFAPLKRQEANLITTKEALQNQVAPLAKAEAIYNTNSPYNGLSTIKEKAGNVANLIKDPKTTVTQTILRESPATKVSTLLQKSLDDLPDHIPPPPPPAQMGTTPQQPMLGKGPIPTVQGTPVNPFPPSGPLGLPAPGPEPFPQQPQLSAPPKVSQLPGGPQGWRLSSASEVPTQTPPSPSPPLNASTARMRVQPLQPSRPTVIPPRGSIAVSPSGEATLPVKGLPAPETTAKPASLSGKALWAQKGAEKMATHGVSASDLDALAQTTKGKQLLVIASDLSPGSAAMKNLVKQIPTALGK